MPGDGWGAFLFLPFLDMKNVLEVAHKKRATQKTRSSEQIHITRHVYADVKNERKKIALWALTCSKGRVNLCSFGATTRPLHLTKAVATDHFDSKSFSVVLAMVFVLNTY